MSIKRGEDQYNISALNLLNSLAFCDVQAALPNPRTESEYRDMRKRVEDAALALSKLSNDKEERPLHHAVTKALMAKWIELETQHGLYPPSKMVTGTMSQDQLLKDRRAALLRTREGGLLYSALRMAEENVIRATTRKAISRIHGVDQNDALQFADDMFTNSLFRYSREHDVLLETFVIRFIDDYLHHAVRPRQRAVFCDQVDQLLDLRESSAIEQLITAEQIVQLRHILAEFNPLDQRILSARYDLDGRGERSFREIGDETGLTHQRAHQRCEFALARLKTALAFHNVLAALSEEKVQDFLSNLRPKDREVFSRLHGFDGHSPQSVNDIADAMTMPLSAVSKIVSRVRKSLIDSYERDKGGAVLGPRF